MFRHLTTLKTPCPTFSSDIVLTDEIKQYVLANRMYRIPKGPVKPKAVQNPSPETFEPTASEPQEPTLLTDDDPSTGYIYMIQEREFLQQKNPTFKIGCTVQEPDNQIKRLKAYKKGSRIVLVLAVDKAHVRSIESAIKSEFTNRFTKHSDGTEYFTGPEKEMRDIVIRCCT
jgi:hypothetical protein